MRGATKLSAILALAASVDPGLWEAMNSLPVVTATPTGRRVRPHNPPLHNLSMSAAQREWNERVDAKRMAKKARGK